MRIEENISLTFDDVLLKPKMFEGGSRFTGSFITLATKLTPMVKMKYPVISANMDTITEEHMAQTMFKNGGLGIVHRFMPAETQVAILSRIEGPKIACIGTGKKALERLNHISSHIAIDAVLIDVAHGHSKSVIEQIKKIKQHHEADVIAGNVATAEGARDLAIAGADCIKVGVGPGSLCSTRTQTGSGVPQFTAILEAAEGVSKANSKTTLIADGGIKNSGDVVKALAAGAHAVMIGSLFAGTHETPGELLHNKDGSGYKVYRGMASRSAQEAWKGTVTSIEGVITRIPFRGNVGPVFEQLINGILSGMSYQNAQTLEMLRTNAIFVRQTQAGYQESTPHGA